MLSRVASRSGSVGRGGLAALVAAVGSLLVVAGHVEAQCQYEVTIIQAPECPIFGFPPTIGLGLSEQGRVVGYHWDCNFQWDQAFVWSPESGLVTLDMPPGTYTSRAYDIDGTQIVGVFDISGDGLGNLGFLYDYQTGEFTNLGTLPGHNWSEALAISQQQGRIVGFSMNNATGPMEAVIWQGNGKLASIGPVLLPPNSLANDISDATGAVTGWMGTAPHMDAHAFIWEAGLVTDLGPIPGGFSSAGNAISDNRRVAGSGLLPQDGFPSGVTRAFLWDDGNFVMLGTLPDHLRSGALDITRDGKQVIGMSWTVDGNPNIMRGFIWQDHVMTDVNNLISPDLNLTVNYARAINSAGQITGKAVDGFADVVGVLLTPVEGSLGDLNNDCHVGILDLLALLAAWGPNPGHPGDLDGDGTVGILDLLALLANWGPCP